MTPLPRFEQRAIAAPGADTNIMSSSITPKMSCRLRIYITLATASVVNYTETISSTTRTIGLNESVPLSAGDEHIFDHSASPDAAYNYQVETNGIITKLKVEEVYE